MRKPTPRQLAAPFVVTASLAGGAVAQPTALPDAPPNSHVEVQPDGTCVAFPKDFKCPPPPSTCNPPPPMPVKCPLPVATDPSRVVKRADGTCFETFHVECAAGDLCNPPPPRDVACPKPPEPPKQVAPNTRIFKGPDGTCREHVDVRCPPGVMCNPPPPRVVPCPPEE